MKKRRYFGQIWLGALVLIVSLMSCSTGIEGTKAIKMNRVERRESQPGPERLLSDRLQSVPLGQWQVGKKFLVVDSKVALILKPEETTTAIDTATFKNVVLEFVGIDNRKTPGGDYKSFIRFRDGKAIYSYDTGRKEQEAKVALTGVDIPMLVDLDLVNKSDSILQGLDVWTTSNFCYDKDGNQAYVPKYSHMNIIRVRPGNKVFPMIVDFKDDKEGQVERSLYMNVRSGNGLGSESRTFDALFSLSDPRLKHANIRDEVWDMICEGKVAVGMTKEECKLSLGNPSDVAPGHNWNATIDLWKYKDGTFLRFEDGLLVDFRR